MAQTLGEPAQLICSRKAGTFTLTLNTVFEAGEGFCRVLRCPSCSGRCQDLGFTAVRAWGPNGDLQSANSMRCWWVRPSGLGPKVTNEPLALARSR